MYKTDQDFIDVHPLSFRAFWQEEMDKEYISTGGETMMEIVELWAGRYLQWYLEKTKHDKEH